MNARWPEIQNPLTAISMRASSLILAVLSCIDSSVFCRSVGSINTSWHMIFRILVVRPRICMWRGLIKPLFLHERAWSIVKQPQYSQVLGSLCSSHPYLSHSSHQKQFCWVCSLPFSWKSSEPNGFTLLLLYFISLLVCIGHIITESLQNLVMAVLNIEQILAQ